MGRRGSSGLPTLRAPTPTGGMRHYLSKQQPRGPDAAAVERGVAAALRAEFAAADGLQPLAGDARRYHVHWVHHRTDSPGDVQPDQLTRKQFWDHLVRCYGEAHPKRGERHANAAREADRAVHYHAAVFTDTQHRWKFVRKLSADKYKMQMHAVAHDAYTTMHKYLREPSASKPLHELDPALFFSVGHPTGDALKQLLENGERYCRVRRSRRPREQPGNADDDEGQAQKAHRSQFGTVYKWVIDHELRGDEGVAKFHKQADEELAQGRPHLLDFAKKHSNSLREQIDFVWHVSMADGRLGRLGKSRLDILADAALLGATQEEAAEACANGGGACLAMYEAIFERQGLCPDMFCRQVFEALEMGRQKGNPVMMVGPPDTGKTPVTKPLEKIYKVMGIPQSDSFCPLEFIRDYELVLFQDFRYAPSHPKKGEQGFRNPTDFRYAPGHPKKGEQGIRVGEGTFNRLLEGLTTKIGVPKSDGTRDFDCEGTAPLIFTGPFQITACRNGVPDKRETDQINSIVKYIFFNALAPPVLNRSFKTCAVCWARWVLTGEMTCRLKEGRPLGALLEAVRNCCVPCSPGASGSLPPRVAASAPSASASETLGAAAPASAGAQMMAELGKLIAWRSQGHLTEAEFGAAKRNLGLS
ncbi:unnamed protein product [Prorocentrum cordatum]|uniref:Uncharacterized protein n=1 Tax=Prorocentrum cordatum TaxID=2364126 RepID=A0ABN9WDM9_9DINO|nr:unnamed protein product [Polarella glacialis]